MRGLGERLDAQNALELRVECEDVGKRHLWRAEQAIGPRVYWVCQRRRCPVSTITRDTADKVAGKPPGILDRERWVRGYKRTEGR